MRQKLKIGIYGIRFIAIFGLFVLITVMYGDLVKTAPLRSINQVIRFDIPTGEFVPSEVKIPEFSHQGGFYTENFILTLSTDEPEATILYTLDSTVPSKNNRNAQVYQRGIGINAKPGGQDNTVFAGMVVRAVTMTKEGKTSDVVTYTYLVDENMKTRYHLPVLSLVTSPDYLYDEKYGIFKNYGERGQEWEHPMHMEYFLQDGTPQISMNVGVRMHGGYSREVPRKSFRLYARKEYDIQNKIEYDFFSDSIVPAFTKNGTIEPITEFKRLLVHNSGNESDAWDTTYFRDVFIHSLMANTKLDVEAYQPVITFLNGNWYGVMNLRERNDDRYLSSHYGISEDEVAIYQFWYGEQGEQNVGIDEGEESELAFYQNMYQFVKDNDFKEHKNYEKVKEWLDIDNFIDYQIIQIYAGNADFPANNCKAWRYTGTPDASKYGLDGKIRWLLYDTDFGFGLYEHWVNGDYLKKATEAGKTEWPNCDGSTLLLRKLLENQEFKRQFSTRYLDLMNTNYVVTDSLKTVDDLSKVYENFVADTYKLYGTRTEYSQNIKEMKEFIKERPSYAKKELEEYVDLGRYYQLKIQVTEHVQIHLNTTTLTSESKGVKNGIFEGSYLNKLPVTLAIVVDEGYEFTGYSYEGSEEIVWKDSTFTITEETGYQEGNIIIPVISKTGFEQVEEVPSSDKDIESDKEPEKEAIDDINNEEEDNWELIFWAIALGVIGLSGGLYLLVKNILNMKRKSKK